MPHSFTGPSYPVFDISRWRLPVLLVVAALLPAPALAHGGMVVTECPVVGLGGDNANFRGIRFEIDQDFESLEVRMDGSQAGVYTLDAELRRSDGFVAVIEATAPGAATLPGTPGTTPYPSVHFDFPLIPVTGTETFTLKFVNIAGPSTLFMEAAGIGNFPCPTIEITDENNVAMPTPRSSPPGFRALGPGALGSSYCGPAVPNSTTLSGVITATGSNVASDNDVTLHATDLPSNQFGYFLNSMTQAFTFPVPNSQGALCLGGQIGRYNASIFNSGTGGAGSLVLDLPTTPTPTGTTSIQAGETWNFTCWYRDNNPGTTSNFTDGFSIQFQ